MRCAVLLIELCSLEPWLLQVASSELKAKAEDWCSRLPAVACLLGCSLAKRGHPDRHDFVLPLAGGLFRLAGKVSNFDWLKF
jgi:hypothetical protein